MQFKIVNKELRTTRFKATWSILRTEHKKMQLASVDDYDELVKQVCNKAKPVATLEISECEREEAPTTTDGTVERNSNGESTGKKRKVTAEEEEMTGIIAQLHGTQRCSDQTCTSRYCFVGNATAKHVRLTPFLLNIWAGAILAEMPGVDTEKPPPATEEKAFWSLDTQPEDLDDIDLLASRRRAVSSKPNSAVTINNDFSGLAAILTPFLTKPANPAAAPSTPTPKSSLE
ncbi:hypothetical protein B0H13DRAFT_1855896 [Mycena leptocephala]|nr:hypothetical protein B0H13DRAFT_1855896 [Mycena leptocephala]